MTDDRRCCSFYLLLIDTFLLLSPPLVPPSKVSIKLTPKQPVVGAQLDILCETGSSNPESEVSWWRDGFSLEGHKEGVIEGLYGGKATRDTLKLNVSSADDGTVITCQGKWFDLFYLDTFVNTHLFSLSIS